MSNAECRMSNEEPRQAGVVSWPEVRTSRVNGLSGVCERSRRVEGAFSEMENGFFGVRNGFFLLLTVGVKRRVGDRAAACKRLLGKALSIIRCVDCVPS